MSRGGSHTIVRNKLLNPRDVPLSEEQVAELGRLLKVGLAETRRIKNILGEITSNELERMKHVGGLEKMATENRGQRESAMTKLTISTAEKHGRTVSPERAAAMTRAAEMMRAQSARFVLSDASGTYVAKDGQVKGRDAVVPYLVYHQELLVTSVIEWFHKSGCLTSREVSALRQELYQIMQAKLARN